MVKLTQAALAGALDLSPAMVSRLVARGMPTHDVEAARRWRREHLDPLRTKDGRMPSIPPAPRRPRAAEPRNDIVERIPQSERGDDLRDVLRAARVEVVAGLVVEIGLDYPAASRAFSVLASELAAVTGDETLHMVGWVPDSLLAQIERRVAVLRAELAADEAPAAASSPPPSPSRSPKPRPTAAPRSGFVTGWADRS